MALLSPPPISETELSAYVDGEAFPERRALIEAWLARNPADAAKVRAWRRQNQALRAAMGRLLCEHPPAILPRSPAPRSASDADPKVTRLFPEAPKARPASSPPWERRDLIALASAGSFLAGAGVACLAGYFLT